MDYGCIHISPTYYLEYNKYSNNDSLREVNIEIADRRIEKIKREYEDKGYKVIINKNFNAGVDVIIIDRKTGQIRKVIEATNYGYEWEYIKPNKFKRYVDSLNSFNDLPNVEKELITSYKTNLGKDQIEELRRNNINHRIEGRQD